MKTWVNINTIIENNYTIFCRVYLYYRLPTGSKNKKRNKTNKQTNKQDISISVSVKYIMIVDSKQYIKICNKKYLKQNESEIAD